jgi:F-type H+-transporting ATPase subunit a
VDFGNKNLSVLFTWGDTTVYLTETIFATWILMGLLFIFTIFVNIRLRKFKGVPRGFQNVIEALIDMMRKFASETLGEELEQLNGYFFGAFTFILTSNYSGMFGLRPPTSDLATTGALALITFSFIHGLGFAKQKGKYLKSYIEPVALFLPINLIGELAKPLSMAFRLFGNMLSGVIIGGMIYNMLPFVLRFMLPNVAHLYFDILVGALQSYVFVILSMTFIREKSTPQS